MNYEFRFRLKARPTITIDGSGLVKHDVDMVQRKQGGGKPWADAVVVGGRHKNIMVPHQALLDAIAMPTQQLQVAAYKEAISDNLATGTTPNNGWTMPELEDFMDDNDLVKDTVAAVTEFIEVTLGQTYPITFSM